MSYLSLISTNLLLTRSLYSTILTLHVPAGVTSATIATAPGSSFIDGTTSKRITGYITVCSNAQNSNIWTIQDIFPYSNDFATIDTLTVSSLSIRGSSYLTQYISSTGSISTLGTLIAGSFTQQGIPLLTTSNLVSTINELGTFGYISSVSSFVISTFSGLGSMYISTASLVSTVNGIGSIYISSPAVQSTIACNSDYIRKDTLVSTIDGLGSTYISTSAIQSTIVGLSNTYVTSNAKASTLEGLLTLEQNALRSTVQNLGAYYISSSTLQSTVNGLGNIYVSSAQVSLFIESFATVAASYLLIDMVTNMSSNGYISTSQLVSTVSGTATNMTSNVQSLGYISSTQLTSTVSGLGSIYISSLSLQSTVSGIKASSYSNLVSSVTGLASLNYISFSQLVSTVNGVSNISKSNLIGFYDNLGTSTYISSPQLVSTVEGISQFYIQTPSLVSTTLGYSNIQVLQIQNIVRNAGLTYISTSGSASTSVGLTTSFSNLYVSTLLGLTTYLKVNSLVSTVQGLGIPYISSSALESTFTSLQTLSGNTSIPALENSLGNTYISTSALVSSTAGIQASLDSINTQLMRTTFGDLQAYQYTILPDPNNSLNYYSKYPSGSTQDLSIMVATLSNGYFTPFGLDGPQYLVGCNLTSTISGIAALNYISTDTTIPSTITEAIYISTSAGLGNLSLAGNANNSYVSTTSLVSTVNNLYVRQLTSTTLDFSTRGFSNFPQLFPNGYVYSSGSSNLSTTSNFYEESNLTRVSLPIISFGSNIARTFKTVGFGSNYIFGDGTYLTISSDRHYKDNIVPISSAIALEQVLSLDGVYYKKRGDTQSYIGCIAQDVEKVFPEVITTHPSTEPRDLKSMKYEFLTAPLVESVKELIRMHSTLKYFAQKKRND